MTTSIVIGEATFSVLVWSALAVVFAVFAYIAYNLIRDQGANP